MDKNYIYLLIGISGALILGITIFFLFFKKRGSEKYIKQINILEKQYKNSILVPIKHRLNKIENLSKQNEVFKEIHKEYQKKFENMEVGKGLIFDDLDMLRKTIAASSLKSETIITKIDEITNRINSSSKEYIDFNNFLIDLTKEEDNYREKVQELKEFYRNITYAYNTSKNELFLVIDKFDQLFLEADQAFMLLDNYINAGNYLEAKELLQPVKEYLENIKSNITTLPPYITKANFLLNKKLKDINNLYRNLSSQNFPLYHLKFNTLNEDTERRVNTVIDSLREFKVNGVQEELDNIEKILEEFLSDLDKEITSKKLYDEYCSEIYKNVEEVEKRYFSIKRTLPELKKIYLISVQEVNSLENMQSSVVQLGSSKYALDTFIYSATKQPFSILVDRMKKMGELAKTVEDYLNEFDLFVSTLKQDVENIYNSISEMMVTVKTLQSSIRQTNIESFIETYEIKIASIKSNIDYLNEILVSCPINVEKANELYNEIKNNIIKVNEEGFKNINFLTMAEQIIIFGNYYRENFSEVELNLKRAEVMLKNGDFLSSLDLAVEVVKKIHPEAYARASMIGK